MRKDIIDTHGLEMLSDQMKEYVIDTLGKRPTERARNRRPPGDKCNQEDKCDQGKQDKQVARTGGLIKETVIGKISTRTRFVSSRPHAWKLSFGVSSALLNRPCETPYNLLAIDLDTSLKWISIDKISIDNEYLHRR